MTNLNYAKSVASNLPAFLGFALNVGVLLLTCDGLPSSVRLCFGQPCSPFEAGALPVLRPARPRFRFGLTRAPHESPTSGGYRRIHIRLRGRVPCNPPHLKGFRTPARTSPSATPLRFGGYSLHLLHQFRTCPPSCRAMLTAIARNATAVASAKAKARNAKLGCANAVVSWNMTPRGDCPHICFIFPSKGLLLPYYDPKYLRH